MVSHLQNWVSHCKDWASKHNIKYSNALKSTECRNSYKNRGNSEATEATNQVKTKRKYVRKIKTQEPPSELPKEVLNVIQKRKYTRKTPTI
jgi:phosphomevalonate kinase